MSWLRESIGKVRELGAELPSPIFAASSPRQGTSLVTAAKQVKDRLVSERGDAQLEAQALAAVEAGPKGVEQLCQAWCRQLNTAASVANVAKDECARRNSGEHS